MSCEELCGVLCDLVIIVMGSQSGNLPLSSTAMRTPRRIYKSTATFLNGYKSSGWCTVQFDGPVSEQRQSSGQL